MSIAPPSQGISAGSHPVEATDVDRLVGVTAIDRRDAKYHRRPERHFVLFCVVPADCGGGANRLLRALDVIRRLGGATRLTKADTECLRQEVWSWNVPAAAFKTASMSDACSRHAVLGRGGTVRWRLDNLRSGDPSRTAPPGGSATT